MNFSFQERYRAGDSLLHRLDPRIKVVVTLVLIVGIVMTPPAAWPAYALLWTLLGGLALLGRLGFWRVARTAGLALPFSLAAATLMFTTPGNEVLRVFGLVVSDAGLARFAAILLKSWLAVQAALLLAMTTPFTDLLWALASLRLPQTLVAIIGLMYRYLFTLRDEAERLMRARAARSGSLANHRSGGSLGWRARVAGGMVGSLFLRSYERSERVYAAMLARGYTGRMRALDPPPLRWQAVVLGGVPLAALAIIQLLAARWWA